jgi:hypothetical protein
MSLSQNRHVKISLPILCIVTDHNTNRYKWNIGPSGFWDKECNHQTEQFVSFFNSEFEALLGLTMPMRRKGMVDYGFARGPAGVLVEERREENEKREGKPQGSTVGEMLKYASETP